MKRSIGMLFFLFLLRDWYLSPIYGRCDTDHPEICVRYVYDALAEALERSPTQVELLAITYYGELALFGEENRIAYEALTRNFFDGQSGACRFNHDSLQPDYDCSHLFDWLGSQQHWRDSAVMDKTQVRVDLYRLLGVYPGTPEPSRGYLRYLESIQQIVFDSGNIEIWRSGQGPDVPSTWGSIRLEAGAVQFAYERADEVQALLIVHYYADKRPTYDRVVEGVPICTLATVITTTQGRLPGLTTCQ